MVHFPISATHPRWGGPRFVSFCFLLLPLSACPPLKAMVIQRSRSSRSFSVDQIPLDGIRWWPMTVQALTIFPKATRPLSPFATKPQPHCPLNPSTWKTLSPSLYLAGSFLSFWPQVPAMAAHIKVPMVTHAHRAWFYHIYVRLPCVCSRLA